VETSFGIMMTRATPMPPIMLPSRVPLIFALLSLILEARFGLLLELQAVSSVQTTSPPKHLQLLNNPWISHMMYFDQTCTMWAGY